MTPKPAPASPEKPRAMSIATDTIETHDCGEELAAARRAEREAREEAKGDLASLTDWLNVWIRQEGTLQVEVVEREAIKSGIDRLAFKFQHRIAALKAELQQAREEAEKWKRDYVELIPNHVIEDCNPRGAECTGEPPGCVYECPYCWLKEISTYEQMLKEHPIRLRWERFKLAVGERLYRIFHPIKSAQNIRECEAAWKEAEKP